MTNSRGYCEFILATSFSSIDYSTFGDTMFTPFSLHQAMMSSDNSPESSSRLGGHLVYDGSVHLYDCHVHVMKKPADSAMSPLPWGSVDQLSENTEAFKMPLVRSAEFGNGDRLRTLLTHQPEQRYTKAIMAAETVKDWMTTISVSLTITWKMAETLLRSVRSTVRWFRNGTKCGKSVTKSSDKGRNGKY